MWVDRLGSLFGWQRRGPGAGCAVADAGRHGPGTGALVAQAARVREHAGLQHHRQAGRAGGAHCVEQMSSRVRRLAGGLHLSLKDIGLVV